MITDPDCHNQAVHRDNPSSLSPKKLSADPFIHPYELSFFGYSGSGKTTLISKLVASLSSKYDILYYKHNAHHFEMDRPGKDTHVVKNSGAGGVLINDPHRLALIGERDLFTPSNLLWSYDLALIEGGKNIPTPKIVVLDPQNKILEKVHTGDITDVIATVGTSENLEILGHSRTFPLSVDLPHFHRDSIDRIAEFVENYFKEKIPPLHGLMMIGGKSSRMGQDKFSLTYGGKKGKGGEKQIERLHSLLKSVCEKVWVSCRKEQSDLPAMKNYSHIYDRIEGVGPMGGILSAQMTSSNTAWLVVAVDMPFIDEEALTHLIQKRNFFKTATCFWNQERKWSEPLCTIYEPKSKTQLLHRLAMGKYCLRKFLTESRVMKTLPPNPRSLFNVNTPHDYQEAMKVLS